MQCFARLVALRHGYDRRFTWEALLVGRGVKTYVAVDVGGAVKVHTAVPSTVVAGHPGTVWHMESEIDTDEREHDDDHNLGDKVEDVEARLAKVPRLCDRLICGIEKRSLWDPGDHAAEKLSCCQDSDCNQQDGNVDPKASGAKFLDLHTRYEY